MHPLQICQLGYLNDFGPLDTAEDTKPTLPVFLIIFISMETDLLWKHEWEAYKYKWDLYKDAPVLSVITVWLRKHRLYYQVLNGRSVFYHPALPWKPVPQQTTIN